MKILAAGATGFIGSELVPFLKKQGHDVKILGRKKATSRNIDIDWNPYQNKFQLSDFENFDAVINLAGENISGLWTDLKKKKIMDSRVQTTNLLCEIFRQLKSPPKVLVNASAMGYYGNQGDTVLTEDSPSGNGFLADVCKEWEAATQPAQQQGIRVVQARFGVVLSQEGGALRKLCWLYKFCLGGRIGSGKQYMSWILREELCNIIHYILMNASLSGPINVGTPNPVTNEEFNNILGRVLNRPTPFPVPEFVIRTFLGEMGEEMLLSSIRMQPIKLLNSGYAFQFPILEGALTQSLKGVTQ